MSANQPGLDVSAKSIWETEQHEALSLETPIAAGTSAARFGIYTSG